MWVAISLSETQSEVESLQGLTKIPLPGGVPRFFWYWGRGGLLDLKISSHTDVAAS